MEHPFLIKMAVFHPKFATIYRNCTNFTPKSIRVGKNDTLLQNSIIFDHICEYFYFSVYLQQPPTSRQQQFCLLVDIGFSTRFLGSFTKLYVNV